MNQRLMVLTFAGWLFAACVPSEEVGECLAQSGSPGCTCRMTTRPETSGQLLSCDQAGFSNGICCASLSYPSEGLCNCNPGGCSESTSGRCSCAGYTKGTLTSCQKPADGKCCKTSLDCYCQAGLTSCATGQEVTSCEWADVKCASTSMTRVTSCSAGLPMAAASTSTSSSSSGGCGAPCTIGSNACPTNAPYCRDGKCVPSGCSYCGANACDVWTRADGSCGSQCVP